jgi:predicted nuclease with TOPRIM domain
LTLQGFSNYSGGMDADLKALEEKLTQLIAQTRLLRSENLGLRQELEQAQDNVKHLKGNMMLASTRLEALIGRLPDEVAELDKAAVKESL